MKQIAEITDMDILNKDGYSNAEPRITARAILENTNNLFAIMYSDDFDFYSFPGGGVEKAEDILEALKREIKEETGCNCSAIEELGFVKENRAYCDYTQISYYFFVRTNDTELRPVFTEAEKKHKTTVNWYSLDDVIKLIKEPFYDNIQRRFLQARDIAVLNEFRKNKGLDNF